MDKALEWFARGWLALIVGINAFGVYLIVRPASGIFDAFSRVKAIVNPENIVYIGFEFVLVLPLLATEAWREFRKKDAASE